MELISYETIRNAHRAEKEEELQRLQEGFFESVRNWFSHKEKLKDTTSLLEVENAKKLLEDIVNRRERKIVLAALGTVRGQMPPASLTDDERRFFDQIVNSLKAFKNDISDRYRSFDGIAEDKLDEARKSLETLKPENTIEKTFIKPNGKLLVKALVDLPRFVGSDMESYGPMKTGDAIYVPEEVGKQMIERKVAQNMLE